MQEPSAAAAAAAPPPETPAEAPADPPPAGAAAVPLAPTDAAAEAPAAAPPAPDADTDADTGATAAPAAEAPSQPPPEPAPARPEPTLAEIAAALARQFPALFGAGVFKPLKLRIQADIQQRAPGAFTRKQLSVLLHRHTTSTAYLKALVASPQRFDLDGAPAGEVAAEHREAAAAEVQRRRELIDQRRAAERAARGPRRIGPAQPAAGPGGGSDAAPGPRPPASAAAPDARARPERQARPPRAPRPERPERPERARRPDHAGVGPGAGAGRRHAESAPGQGPGPRPPRRHDEAARRPTPADGRGGPAVAGPEHTGAALPDDPARRERALLLRAWEGSPLAPANFCALKGLKRADFEAQIELARRERAERGGGPPRG